MIPEDKQWLVFWNLPRMAEFRTRLDAERFAEILSQMPALRDIQIVFREDTRRATHLPYHTGKQRQ